jgi:hypothetical protein
MQKQKIKIIFNNNNITVFLNINKNKGKKIIMRQLIRQYYIKKEPKYYTFFLVLLILNRYGLIKIKGL